MTDVEPASDAGQPRPLGPLQERLRHQENLEKLASQSAPAGVRITSVRWGRTVNTGNFSSARLDVEAAVDMGGEPGSTLDQLRAWVDAHMPPAPEQVDKLMYERETLQNDIHSYTARRQQIEAEWKRAKDWMDKLGLTVPDRVLEDLPF